MRKRRNSNKTHHQKTPTDETKKDAKEISSNKDNHSEGDGLFDSRAICLVDKLPSCGRICILGTFVFICYAPTSGE